MKIRLFALFLVGVLFFSCSVNSSGNDPQPDPNSGTDPDPENVDADLSGFKVITENYPYSDLNPAAANDYWKLEKASPGQCFGAPAFDILAEHGTLCKGVHQTYRHKCKQELNSLRPESGFRSPNSYYCARDYLYLLVQNAQGNMLVNTVEELKDFLVPIDDESEAILLAAVMGYDFEREDIDHGAYKKVDDGYELHMIKMISDCGPIEFRQYHLKVNREGEISVLSDKIYIYDENGCI